MSERRPPRGRSIRRANARRFRLALLAALTTVTAGGVVGLAQALTPGDLQGTPRLGQPLRLDFPLSLEPGESTDGLEVSVRARPSLGAVNGEAWLSSPFRILLTDRDGRPTLRICNEQLVQEPMLELRLALRSAAGVITRRRYDVLVDPPLAGVASAACEPPDAAALTSRRRVTRPPVRRPAETVMDRRSFGQEVRVVRGDTLGELAQALRGDHAIALPLMTDALYRSNRDAFIDNPDRLRAGSRLRVPDLDALARDGVAALPAATAGSSDAPVTAPADAAIPPSAPPEAPPGAPPAPWPGPLMLSYRLSTPPSLAEQRLVAQRYVNTASGGAGAKAPARIDETRPSASVGGPSMPLLMVIIVALLGALMWMLRGVLARRPRAPRPTSAMTPTPQAAVAAAPAKARPASGRTAEADEEVGRDFYAEVASLLIAELGKNPKRRDLRFRLLELYFTSGKRDAFVEHTHDYLRSLHGTPDENWAEIARMGRQIAPETGLYPDHAGQAPHSQAPHSNVIPLQAARSPSRRFYEDVDPAALRDLREHLDRSYAELRRDSMFWRQLATLAGDSISPHAGLVPAERLTQYLGGAQILFRDERRRPADESAALVAVGQVLMARRVGYERVVAGGMRSRHALLVAQTAQKLGIGCDLHLSSVEQSHHAGALERLMGSQLTLHTVEESETGLAGTTQLQALRDALRNPGSMYVSPAAAGPPPYPTIVTDLAALLGRNLRLQMFESLGRAADVLIMNREDGLNTIGLMETFLDSADTRLLCIESDRPASVGMLFPREHRLLRTTGRVEYQRIAEETARFITQFCAERQYAQLELAGSEVFAAALRVARDLPTGHVVVAVLPPESHMEVASASEQQQRVAERLRGLPTPRA